MEITYRKINTIEDYGVLKTFWEASAMGVAPNLSALPLDGIVVEVNGEITGAIFMWLTSNSLVCFIGYPILNPEYRETNRKDILKELLNKAETIVEYQGYETIMHYSKVPVMDKFLTTNGYVNVEDNVNTYQKLL